MWSNHRKAKSYIVCVSSNLVPHHVLKISLFSFCWSLGQVGKKYGAKKLINSVFSIGWFFLFLLRGAKREKGKKRSGVEELVNSSGSWPEDYRFESCPRTRRSYFYGYIIGGGEVRSGSRALLSWETWVEERYLKRLMIGFGCIWL